MNYSLTPEQAQSITDLDVAFGTTRFLPKMDDIPQQFFDGNTIYNDIANVWFYGGTMPEGECVMAEGFQGPEMKEAIHRCLRAHLKSWDPKHEHKMAGVAYMISKTATIERI